MEQIMVLVGFVGTFVFGVAIGFTLGAFRTIAIFKSEEDQKDILKTIEKVEKRFHPGMHNDDIVDL